MRQVALITGGSRGIGAACVRRFARAGFATVFLYKERTDAAEALTAELRAAGLDAAAYRCDVADAAAVARTAAEIMALYHRVDVLVNNAAVSRTGLLTDTTPEAWREVLSVNLDGAFYVTSAFLPGMLRRGTGCIVNISSMWGQVGASCEAAYSAAKAGLIGLTKALAKEVGPSGIRVNCVAPGVIDTEMNAHLSEADLAALADDTPLGRLGTPEEVAESIFYLASPQAGFITGQVLGVNGGIII